MSNFADPIARKKALIEEARRKNQPTAEDATLARVRDLVKPADAPSRTRIVFDNSGSMADSLNAQGKPSTKMKEALKGCIEYLRNCTLNRDAVAIHMLNSYSSRYWEDEESGISDLINNSDLTTDLLRLASALDNKNLVPTGSTPLYETIIAALEAEPKLTRMVAFSDGEPNNFNGEDRAVALATRFKVKIDTVYFGHAASNAASVMKRLAEATGGIFIVFDPIKGVNFATAFKYLTEGNRKLLMNAEFKAKLERGEIK